MELWVESCVERGTLDEALRETGFRPTAWGSTSEESDRVRVRVERAARSSAIGAESEVEITIPAYQVAALQSAERTSARAWVHVSWQELRDSFLPKGCHPDRIQGDDLVMTRAGVVPP